MLLAVSDTGGGMDADTMSHLFEPFFTTKGPGKGTGLGLATVYGIVRQSGGCIFAYSEPGHGTTLKVYFPQAGADGARAAVHYPDEALTRGGTETILLVEDEGGVRSLARTILEMKGYTVLEAQNADEALALWRDREATVHLILTDVIMPGMNGRVLANRLIAADPSATVKVLFMSGYTDDAIVHHGVLDPGTAFLQKPFTPDDLARKVREVLDSSP